MSANAADDETRVRAGGRGGQNRGIAAQMAVMAQTLEAQRAPRSRVRAFRRATGALETLAAPVADILRDGGLAALVRVPGMGEDAARAVAEIVATRRWAELDRLRGIAAPEPIFRRLEGVGPRLAARLAETLHVDTLAGLAAAARDGRLASLREIGPRRADALRAALAAIDIETGPPPPAAMLLGVDRSYRAAAAAGILPRIAPTRNNPRRIAWLPVLHAREGGWTVTAMHPPPPGAATGAPPDEVMLFARLREGPESQWCVATRPDGDAGWRVVLGREAECPPPTAQDDG
jgi:hypothetical protein